MRVPTKTCICRKRTLARCIVSLARASGSGLGHPATHLRSLQRCALCTHCWAAAMCVRGLRVESSHQNLHFACFWALPECASGGTVNTHAGKGAQGICLLGAQPNLHLPQAYAGSVHCVTCGTCIGFKPWPPCHTPPLPSALCTLHSLLGCRHVCARSEG